MNQIQCEFCGDLEGEDAIRYYNSDHTNYYLGHVWIWLNHFEQCLEVPRFVNICGSCHTLLHRFLINHSKVDAEILLRRRYDKYPVR